LIAEEYKDFKRGDDPVSIKISKMLLEDVYLKARLVIDKN
jgi:hypothetical protein